MISPRALYLICLFLVPIAGHTQNTRQDTIKYIIHTDQFGAKKRIPVAYVSEILIVEGDSIFAVSNDLELQNIIERKKEFTIINHPDSVKEYFQKRFRAIIILKPDE